MNTYAFTYRMPDGFERTPEAVVEWSNWFAQLGTHVVDRGNPIFTRTSVGETATTALGGYSLVEATSLEEAAELAAGCPVVANGGGVEVGEITVVDVAHA